MKKNKFSINKFLIYLYFFCIIFGSKIAGFIDFSLLAGIVGIIVGIANKKRKKIALIKEITILMLILIVLIIYITLIVLINQTYDITDIFRYIRCLINLISIPIVINYTNLSKDEIIGVIVPVLSINSFLILIGGINTEIGFIIRSLTGYSSYVVRYLRFPGFVSGYDMAGLIVNIDFFIITITSAKNNKKRTLLQFIVLLSVLFTSRFSMVLMVFNLIISIIFYKKAKFRGVVLIYSIILIVMFVFIVCLLIVSTDFGGFKIFDVIMNKIPYFNEVSRIFADSEFSTALEANFNFYDLKNIIFGDGYYPMQDSGYSKTIFLCGIIGLIMHFIFYLFILKSAFKVYYQQNQKDILIFIIFFWVVCVFVLSIKNNYYMTRNITEIGLIVYTAIINDLERSRLINE